MKWNEHAYNTRFVN